MTSVPPTPKSTERSVNNNSNIIEHYPDDPQTIYESKGDNWYVESRFYWSIQDISVESMINGPENLSSIDLKFTYNVLSLLKYEGKINGGHLVDLGCGIGRVSYQVLTHFYDKIDLVDPIPHLLIKAQEYMEKDAQIEIYRSGIEEWIPEHKYDGMWCQWVLCHLTDSDLVMFLRRAKDAMADNALIFIKENVAGHDLNDPKSHYEYYPERNSLCRTFVHWKEIFVRSGLILEEYRIQPDWPDNMLTVVLFVLKS